MAIKMRRGTLETLYNGEIVLDVNTGITSVYNDGELISLSLVPKSRHFNCPYCGAPNQIDVCEYCGCSYE